MMYSYKMLRNKIYQALCFDIPEEATRRHHMFNVEIISKSTCRASGQAAAAPMSSLKVISCIISPMRA